jgi:hypothetical protein
MEPIHRHVHVVTSFDQRSLSDAIPLALTAPAPDTPSQSTRTPAFAANQPLSIASQSCWQSVIRPAWLQSTRGVHWPEQPLGTKLHQHAAIARAGAIERKRLPMEKARDC